MKQITREHRVFERIDVFFTKYANESSVFLDNGRFWKIGHPIDFRGP